jgi:phenylacetate-CoA ligase
MGMRLPITPLEPWIASKLGRRAESLTRTALEAYQLQKLRETLHFAREKSRFYRERLVAAPRTLNCLADLARFPFTTPRDIRDNALQFVCVSQDEIQRVVTLDSSGTTGPAKRLYFTRDDQELTIDFFHIGMSTLSAPGDRVLILLPCERPGSVGDLLAIALGRLNAEGIRHGPVQDVAETLSVMAQAHVNCLVGAPVQVLRLARSRPGLSLKSALLTTDYVSVAIARAVERAWECQVYNHYGMTEMGLGGGVECQAHRGYHLREADLYFEVVNPVTGQPAAEGETGEVVFTTLTRRGMPLIRYRTGDLSRFVPGQCPCGTLLKTLECVRGRANGYVAVGERWHVCMADLDEALFPIEGVLDFAAAMTRRGGKDSLRLEVKTAGSASDDMAAAVNRALDSIPAIHQAELADQLGVAVIVQAQAAAGMQRLSKRMISAG